MKDRMVVLIVVVLGLLMVAAFGGVNDQNTVDKENAEATSKLEMIQLACGPAVHFQASEEGTVWNSAKGDFLVVSQEKRFENADLWLMTVQPQPDNGIRVQFFPPVAVSEGAAPTPSPETGFTCSQQPDGKAQTKVF